MNIREVDMLSGNLWEFYHAFPKPYLRVQTGGHVWYYDKDKITRYSYPHTPQELSEWLFNWVKE